jgi:hypothetical protein
MTRCPMILRLPVPAVAGLVLAGCGSGGLLDISQGRTS